MRFVKLFVLGLGVAALSLSATSNANAGTPSTITGTSAYFGSTIAAKESILFKVLGTGTCRIQTKVVGPNGEESSEISAFPKPLPTAVSAAPKVPGAYKIIVTTVADPQLPDCAAGQTVTALFTSFKMPVCPSGWSKVSADKYTGEISCVAAKPTLTCASKREAFYTPANGVCEAGCQQVVY